MIDSLKKLNHPVFTTGDISNLTGKSREYTKVYLFNLIKRGLIGKIERGKYYLLGTSPYVIASRIVKDSYITLISAARIYNITTQIPNIIYVFSPIYHRPIKIIDNYKVKFIKVDKQIIYGYHKYNDIYVAEPEKLFIDDIYYHKSLFYDEELNEAINKNILDTEKIAEYIGRLKSEKIEKREYSILKDKLNLSEYKELLDIKELFDMIDKKSKLNKSKFRHKLNA